MPTTGPQPVKSLQLDLKNYRTIPQPDEESAIAALVAYRTEWFWALAESLISDGFLPTENILVISTGPQGAHLIVKEGNRRIAVLKIILGLVSVPSVTIPENIEKAIGKLSATWKKANANVPCAIYAEDEASTVDRIIRLAHAKGENAGRSPWGAVARARHNRDEAKASEPGLDLLEKYLKQGQNLTDMQKKRWAGEYTLTVLNEALPRLAQRIGVATSRTLVDEYPKVKYRTALERILHDIGTEIIGFPQVRSADFAIAEGIPPLPVPTPAASPTPSPAKPSGTSAAPPNPVAPAQPAKRKAVAVNDPRAVSRVLKKFSPVGHNREKLVTLLEEARRLNVDKYPHAFSFLLRSMFEISAKAYCNDHAKSAGPKFSKSNGEDRPLIDVLRDVTNHLTKNKTDRPMLRALHGAITVLASATNIFSVTSLNQLIHSSTFVIDGRSVATMFANVFPLLEAMNS